MDVEQTGSEKTKGVVFSDKTLLAAGIKDEPGSERNLQIRRREIDTGLAFIPFGNIQADVAVLTGEHPAEEFPPAVIAILKQDSTIKVVEVTLESGVIHIYGKELQDFKVNGLLEAIKQSKALKNGSAAGLTTTAR
ncbi:MAG: hypothetical protein JXA42_25745 [Anaerolineales bacterium]|nr:hypothetical protein [Anaerolineales bacterium]